MSLTERTVRYWKVAPGNDAWQWQECHNGSFIDVGWDELGDLSAVTHREFDAKRADLAKTDRAPGRDTSPISW